MFRISSKYQAVESIRGGRIHNGIDFAMPEGTNLKSIADGVVRVVDYGNVGAGKTVFVDGVDGKTYMYGHLKDFRVATGQEVGVGELIGVSGNSGFSTGPHLHFAVKEGGSFIDPAPYVDAIQNMDKLQFVIEKAPEIQSLSSTDILQYAFERFSETLTDMSLNLIQLLSTHGGLGVLDLILSLLS